MLSNNEECEWSHFTEAPIKISQSTFSNYKNRLERKGYIENVRRGYYKITSSGKERFYQLSQAKEVERKLNFPPDVITDKRNYDHWILWMVYNNNSCRWPDFTSDPLSINQSSLSKNMNELIDGDYIRKENKEYFITEKGKIHYSEILKRYDLDRQSILEEESKRIEEITRYTNSFFQDYEIQDENIKFRFLNNVLNLNYSEVENLIDDKDEFNKILLFLSLNHPDQYPEYISPENFALKFDIKLKVLEFFIEKIVEENFYPVHFFKIEVFPDKEYYFQSNGKLERILRAIVDEYITKHTYLSKLSGVNEDLNQPSDVVNLLNTILREISTNLFVEELKDALRKFLPKYIKYLAYKIETERKLITDDAKREGFIWQNVYEEFQSFEPTVIKKELEEDIYTYNLDRSIFKALDILFLSKFDFMATSEFKNLYSSKSSPFYNDLELLLSTGKISKAKSLMETYYDGPTELENLILRDLISTYDKNLEESVKITDQIIENYSDSYIGYLLKSITLTRLLKYDEAMVVINKGLETSENVSLLCQKIQLLLYREEINNATELIDKLLVEHPSNLLAIKTKILTILHDPFARIPTDIEIVDRGIKSNPKEKSFYILKAILLCASDRYKEAKRLLKNELFFNILDDKEPRLETATFFTLAYTYLAQGKYDKAVNIADQTLNRYNDHPTANLTKVIVIGYDLIYTFSAKDPNSFNKFIGMIDMTISLESNNLTKSRYYKLKAIVLEQIKKHDMAIKALDKAIELAPMILSYQRHKSWILFVSGRQSESLELLDKLILEFPQRIVLLSQIKSFIHFDIGEYELGIEVCKKALELYPKEHDLVNNIAIFLAKANRMEEAIETCKKLVSMAPDIGNYHDSYGEVLLIAGQYKQALEEFEKAIELNPTGWFIYDTYTKMGKSCEALGDEEEAKACFEKAEKLKEKVLPTFRLIYDDK